MEILINLLALIAIIVGIGVIFEWIMKNAEGKK